MIFPAFSASLREKTFAEMRGSGVLHCKGARSESDADLRQPRQGRHLCRTKERNNFKLRQERVILSNQRRPLCREYAAPTGLEKMRRLDSTEISLLTELFAPCFIRVIREILGLISSVTDVRPATLRLRAFALKSLFLMEKSSWPSN
jgi:hypothetical protein